MAANLKFTLKRNNGTDYDELYPKTNTAQVVGLSTALNLKVNNSAIGVANGVASLDANSKIPVAQLPDAVFDSLRFGSVVYTEPAADFAEYLEEAYDTAFSTNKSMVGVYLVAGAALSIANEATGVQGTVSLDNYWKWNFINQDSAITGAPTSSGTMEIGDWVVIEKFTGLGTSASPFVLSLSIINNTYELATSSLNGIVKLSDGNGGVITGLTGSTVITEGNLIGMVYTAGTDLNGLTGDNADKLAKTNHTHSNYQPLDADLTKIAGLSSADNNFIVGSASGWVVESGATARTSLGLSIGSNVQAYDAGLASIAGLTTTADRMLYTTASDAYAVTTLTAAGRAILDDADAAAQRTTLGLAIGTNVQAHSARLVDIAALAVTDSNIIVGNGTTWVAESGATARTSLGVYSTSEVDAFFTNRPTILYNTTTGAVSGSLILADVVTA
jgi:hypothetical protein